MIDWLIINTENSNILGYPRYYSGYFIKPFPSWLIDWSSTRRTATSWATPGYTPIILLNHFHLDWLIDWLIDWSLTQRTATSWAATPGYTPDILLNHFPPWLIDWLTDWLIISTEYGNILDVYPRYYNRYFIKPFHLDWLIDWLTDLLLSERTATY